MVFSDYRCIGVGGEILDPASPIGERMGRVKGMRPAFGGFLLPDTFLEDLIDSNMILLSTVVLRKRCVEAAGGLNESLRGNDDTDLYIRLAASGVRFGYIPESLAGYRRHAGQITRDIESVYQRRLALLMDMLDDPRWDGAIRARLTRKQASERFLFGNWLAGRGRWDEAAACYRVSVRARPRPRSAILCAAARVTAWSGGMAAPLARLALRLLGATG